MKKEFEAFGDEWRVEMRKHKKEFLIELLKSALQNLEDLNKGELG